MYHMENGHSWLDMWNGAPFWPMGLHGLFSWLVLIALVWFVVSIFQKGRGDNTKTTDKT
jgi:hypothetical protein